ncbi:MAG: DUF6449 domain-containing protein [Lachnospiraceae bacterium]|nr:DUF6449 domain-containing protein [Lachnospiraceae bacterium]
MKSKIFFSKFRSGIFRRELWMGALALLVFFLVLPVSTLMKVELWAEQLNQGMKLWEIQQNYAGMLSFNNLGLLIVTFVSAAVFGITGFAYLHNQRQVDFYYSQPVGRRELFTSRAVVAVLYYVVPYVLNLVLALVIGLAKGVCTSRAFSMAGLAFVHNILLFVIAYMLSVIAMELTGRIFVGILGSATLLLYGWGICYTLMGYIGRNFVTFDPRSVKWLEWIGHLSPVYWGVSDYRNYTSAFTGKSIHVSGFILSMLFLVLVGAATTVLAYFLNKIRKAESANHSMAFPKIGTVIKFAIVIPASLLVGVFTDTFTYQRRFTWTICGIVFSAILLNGIMEIIYHMDFRRVLRHKLQLLLMVCASVAVACIFQFDLFHYDSYLPEREEIADVSVGMDFTQYATTIYADGIYTMAKEYMQEQTSLGNTDIVYAMLQQVVGQQRDIGEEKASVDLKIMDICYKLTNGRRVYRSYQVDPADIQMAFSRIYEMTGVREAAFPVLKADPERVKDIQLCYFSEYMQVATKQSPDRIKLLKAYQQDLVEMSGEALTTEAPIASLNFTYGENEEAYQGCMIFPENKRTLACLKELGYTVEAQIKDKQVELIEIEDYRDDNPVLKSITDAETIDKILPNLVLSECGTIWQQYENNVYVNMSIRTEKGYIVRTSCYFRKGSVPNLD